MECREPVSLRQLRQWQRALGGRCQCDGLVIGSNDWAGENVPSWLARHRGCMKTCHRGSFLLRACRLDVRDVWWEWSELRPDHGALYVKAKCPDAVRLKGRIIRLMAQISQLVSARQAGFHASKRGHPSLLYPPLHATHARIGLACRRASHTGLIVRSSRTASWRECQNCSETSG